MSDPGSPNEVVPLWRLPMEQKQFAAWSGQLGDDAETQPKSSTRFSGDEPTAAASPAAQESGSSEANIFDVAYKKGWEDCEAAIAEENQSNDAACQSLTQALQRITSLQSTGSYEFILRAVEQLFQRCAESALPDPALLQSWAGQLAEYVDADQQSGYLELHPDDLPLIDAESVALPLRAASDLPRGNVRVSHSGGWIEKGSAVVLDELRGLIDEIDDGATGDTGD